MNARPLPDELLTAICESSSADRASVEALWIRLEYISSGTADGVPSDEEAWSALEARIADMKPGGRRDRPPARLTRRQVHATPLLIALLVMIGLWLGIPRERHAHALAGETRVAHLPDGSLVELYGDSRIAYRISPVGRLRGQWTPRSAVLSGEAFFHIRTATPVFEVVTEDARVEVVGTQFLVRSRPSDLEAATLVSVTDGSVRVTSRQSSEERVLLRGEATLLRGEQIIDIGHSGALRVGVWREGGFAVQNLPLADVAREVERRFGVRVTLGDGVPGERSLTLFYGSGVEARSVMHDIALATGLRYRALQGGFELVSDSER